MADPPSDPTTNQPGNRLASYFENFFRTVVGIATLGSSITFSKIVQSPVAPFHQYGFSSKEAQYLLATSWLLFVLTLAFTSFFASALSLWRPQAVAAFGTTTGKDRRKVLWFASAVSALLFGLLIAAFLTLELVVVAYAGPVGWVAVAFTIIFALLGFGTIVWRSPLEWPKWLAVVEQEEQEAFEKHFQRSANRGARRQDEDGLAKLPSRRPPQQPQAKRDDERGDYGRSNSGDFAAGDWRYQGDGDRRNVTRYSKASTIVSDIYESGIYGQRGIMMYDDGVREGMVTGRYAA